MRFFGTMAEFCVHESQKMSPQFAHVTRGRLLSTKLACTVSTRKG